MWVTNGTNIQMTAGDFGVALPITVDGLPAFGSGDTLLLTLKRGTEPVLTRSWSSMPNKTVQLTITEAETQMLRPDRYRYLLDMLHEGVFMYNVLPDGSFQVTPK